MTTSAVPAPTVGDLLERALRERLAGGTAGGEEAEAWAALVRNGLEQALPAGAPPGDAARVARMVRQALDVPLPSVLAAAWQRYEPFRKYLDPERYPPGSETEVPLAEHTARSTLEPEIDVMVSGAVVATLRFEAEVEVALKGAVVTVRDGRFTSLRSGDCTVSATLRFRDRTLARTGPEQERIPGAFEFRDPLPIDPFGPDPYARDLSEG